MPWTAGLLLIFSNRKVEPLRPIVGRLRKGMYRGGKDLLNSLFSLFNGQSRPIAQVINAGWYNVAGEKLGFGDLDSGDLVRIAKGLENGELFLVLAPADAFWHFIRKEGDCLRGIIDPREESPGQEYVAGKCVFILAQDFIYKLEDHFLPYQVRHLSGVDFKEISREEAGRMVLGNGLRP